MSTIMRVLEDFGPTKNLSNNEREGDNDTDRLTVWVDKREETQLQRAIQMNDGANQLI